MARKPKSIIPRSKIRAALRRLWLWSDLRRDAIRAAHIGGTKRPKLYWCASCGCPYPLKEIQVDHIEPAGSMDNAEVFIQRLFCKVEGLQVLCTDCHFQKGLDDRCKKAEKKLNEKES